MPATKRGFSVVIVAGGEHGGLDPSRIPEHDRVIAADSGLLVAADLGLVVDLAIGDFDSVSDDVVAAAEDSGTAVMRFGAAKNSTDLDLALDAAFDLGPSVITIVGGAGGRIDHVLGNALVLAQPRFAEVTATALVGNATVTPVHTGASLFGHPGDLVSLLPVAGPARGVTTSGLLYGLAGGTIEPGSTLGISNEFVDREAYVTVVEGVLLAVQPGETGRHLATGLGPADIETGNRQGRPRQDSNLRPAD